MVSARLELSQLHRERVRCRTPSSRVLCYRGCRRLLIKHGKPGQFDDARIQLPAQDLGGVVEVAQLKDGAYRLAFQFLAGDEDPPTAVVGEALDDPVEGRAAEHQHALAPAGLVFRVYVRDGDALAGVEDDGLAASHLMVVAARRRALVKPDVHAVLEHGHQPAMIILGPHQVAGAESRGGGARDLDDEGPGLAAVAGSGSEDGFAAEQLDAALAGGIADIQCAAAAELDAGAILQKEVAHFAGDRVVVTVQGQQPAAVVEHEPGDEQQGGKRHGARRPPAGRREPGRQRDRPDARRNALGDGQRGVAAEDLGGPPGALSPPGGLGVAGIGLPPAGEGPGLAGR